MSAGPGHVLTLSVTKRDDPCISCSADLSDNLFTCPLAQGAQGQAGKVNFPQSSTSREDILPDLPRTRLSQPLVTTGSREWLRCKPLILDRN